jgi:hypothetical protein
MPTAARWSRVSFTLGAHMNRSRVTAIVLLVVTVLPVTVLFAVVAVIGLPFWVAGIADFLLGNYGWSELRSSVRPDMALLFISAPLGAYGLVALWSTLLRIFRSRPHQSPRSTIVGLLCGIIASAHLVFIKFGLPVLLLPATLFALYHVSKSTKAVRGTNGT